MSKKFNFWFCLAIGVPALVGGMSRLIKYLDLLIDVIFHNTQATAEMLIGVPLILLFVIGTSYLIIRVGIEQWPMKKSS